MAVLVLAKPGLALACCTPMTKGRVKTRIKRLRRNLSLTGAIVALAAGVLPPVILSSSVGIVALVIGEGYQAVVFGVLVVSLAAAAAGGAILVGVLLGRRARIARLQSDLLANVTHELRTPLSSIRMYTQTLQMGRVADHPEKTKECLDTILRETEWLEAMIDGVLTWRGAAKDRTVFQMEPRSLTDSVSDAASRFARMCRIDDMDFKAELASENKVRHDRVGIASVVLNLLVNAYKYTGEEKRIRLVLKDLGDLVELSVEDNGIGIPPQEVGRIFDPFYRVDSRLRSHASGAGLGLAIVRHQVRAHDGEVFVESAPGGGSKFTVHLRAEPKEATDAVSQG
ncbi:MAG: HAMP domain-containing histidine kinase [Myxococcota bacterium]|jgi:two-component system phosphate regulon sensor histidine kinase PhoR|nr:HAMP domain-containing histidine kinase [Myxococcota bacterium]